MWKKHNFVKNNFYPQCKSAPPKFSADTISPVAALTRGGPPKNMVPINE